MLLEIPDDILTQKSYTEQDLRTEVAVSLYQRRFIILERASRWLGINRLAFQKILADREIALHYSIADFQVDLQTLQSM